MKTLYIDVYFLINFTVDLLALHLSSQFTKTPTTKKRLFFASIIGALYSIAGVLLIDQAVIMLPVSLVFFIIMVSVGVNKVSLKRHFKFSFAFLIFEILIAGMVYYAYCTLDKFTDLSTTTLGAQNKKLLILSLMILICMVVLKLIIGVFSNSKTDRVVSVTILEDGIEITEDALVDTGNLACDPFDHTPVMLVGEKLFCNLFSLNKSEDITSNKRLNKRIRVIPISYGSTSQILYGIRADGVFLDLREKREELSVIIALDKNGGKYGGYSVLMPSSAISGIL